MAAVKNPLEAMGWEWFQDSPDSGKWFKYDKRGNQIAKEGDTVWQHDLEQIEKDTV